MHVWLNGQKKIPKKKEKQTVLKFGVLLLGTDTNTTTIIIVISLSEKHRKEDSNVPLRYNNINACYGYCCLFIFSCEISQRTNKI